MLRDIRLGYTEVRATSLRSRRLPSAPLEDVRASRLSSCASVRTTAAALTPTRVSRSSVRGALPSRQSPSGRASCCVQVTKEGKELIKQAARDKGKKISVILQLLGGELPDVD